MKTLEERFWIKVDRSGGPSACWPWTTYINKNGYGHFDAGTGNTTAHRIAYELVIGPIPEGLTLDHLCRNKACCNPTHLEPITHLENVRRHFRHQTHCTHGHEYTPENTYLKPPGWRNCRECRRKSNQESKARRKARQNV